MSGRGNKMTTGTRRKILRNAAKCLVCEEIIESKHRHDFVSCSCWKTDELLPPAKHTRIFVDGGLEYLRFGASDMSRFQPLFEYGELADVYSAEHD